MSEGKMLDNVVCPFYSVGYCKSKVQCHKEHPNEDCSNSLCQRKGCFKRHRKQCRYGGSCKIYYKSCEFLHLHKKLSNHDNKHKDVTGQVRESEECIVKLKQEVLELQKINTEKTILIDDLNFKIVNMVDIIEETNLKTVKELEEQNTISDIRIKDLENELIVVKGKLNEAQKMFKDKYETKE